MSTPFSGPATHSSRDDFDTDLHQLGLGRYVERYCAKIDEKRANWLTRNSLYHYGFNNWQTIFDASESDFEALGILLGHRRVLMRYAASLRGIHLHEPLESSAVAGEVHKQQRLRANAADSLEIRPTPTTSFHRGELNLPRAGLYSSKRRYKRHPKPDENAPSRPPSAYVLFSNQVREEKKGADCSFSELAKIVGERWKHMDRAEKNRHEHKAAEAKAVYDAAVASYRRTSAYQEYRRYLAKFKQLAAQVDGRPEKLEPPARLQRERAGGNESPVDPVICEDEVVAKGDFNNEDSLSHNSQEYSELESDREASAAARGKRRRSINDSETRQARRSPLAIASLVH
ncbi:hypothetical protein PYCC9005_000258 [Savitreella phatthalungensis]